MKGGKTMVNFVSPNISLTIMEILTEFGPHYKDDLKKYFPRVNNYRLEEAFTDLLFDTCIRRNVRIPESQDSDSDIFAYDEDSIGAKDYMAFTEEFLRKSPV